MSTKLRTGKDFLKYMEKEHGPLSFARIIWAWRTSDDYTLKEYSKILGISSQSLCDLEKGRRIPSPKRAASNC
jgi:DNA-binding transcriptional regulator YiaG